MLGTRDYVAARLYLKIGMLLLLANDNPFLSLNELEVFYIWMC